MLINSLQLSVAKYLYDPLGKSLSSSGPLADSNIYRFSSKEAHPLSGFTYYHFRWYDPSSQRWINRDPIGEHGGPNLFEFVGNESINKVDPNGLVFGELMGLAFVAAEIAMAVCETATTQPDCETCCGATWAAGNGALQAAYVYEMASGGITGFLAIIDTLQFVAETGKFAHDYQKCMDNCKTKPKCKPRSPGANPPKSPPQPFPAKTGPRPVTRFI